MIKKNTDNAKLNYKVGGSSIFGTPEKIFDVNYASKNTWGHNWGEKDPYRPKHKIAFDINKRDCRLQGDNLPNSNNAYDESSYHKRNEEANVIKHIYRLITIKERLSSIVQHRIENTFSAIQDPKKTEADKEALVHDNVIVIDHLKEITSEITKNLIRHMHFVSQWVKSDFKACLLKSDTSLARDLSQEASKIDEILTEFIEYYTFHKIINHDHNTEQKETINAALSFLDNLKAYENILEEESATYFTMVENI